MVAFVWQGRRDASATPPEAGVTVETADVVRTDLAVTESLTGTLGFGAAQPLKGGKDGIVTWLPPSGRTIERGQQVYRADDRPVPLFYGTMPLYRELAAEGTVGRDVRIVARNLQALGFSIGRQPGPGAKVTAPAQVTVRKGEGTLTRSLIGAIKRWQRSTGLPTTGRLGVGDVVVLPGAVRIDSVTAQRGDSATTPLVTVTPTAKVITVAATVAQAGTIRAGNQVTVVLPGDKQVPGKVAAVGGTVQENEAEPGGEPKRSVTVTVDDGALLDGIESAKVQVDLAGETRSDVLAVPVGALVALSEGGYAVQSADGALIAVETGMFAKGLVEVTGDGLTEGMRVVTTS